MHIYSFGNFFYKRDHGLKIKDNAYASKNQNNKKFKIIRV